MVKFGGEIGTLYQIFGEILVYAQCPSCPLPFRPSEMPFPQNDLHQNALSEMPFWKCPFRYVLHQNALSVMPIQKCPFKMPFLNLPFLNLPCLSLPFIKLPFIKNAIFSFISDCEISNSEIMKRSQLSGKLSQFCHYLTP